MEQITTAAAAMEMTEGIVHVPAITSRLTLPIQQPDRITFTYFEARGGLVVLKPTRAAAGPRYKIPMSELAEIPVITIAVSESTPTAESEW